MKVDTDPQTQPASAGFFTPVVAETLPHEGGSYIRDAETGELIKTSVVEVDNGAHP